MTPFCYEMKMYNYERSSIEFYSHLEQPTPFDWLFSGELSDVSI